MRAEPAGTGVEAGRLLFDDGAVEAGQGDAARPDAALLEAFALYRGYTWGPWLVVIATSLLLPSGKVNRTCDVAPPRRTAIT